MDLVWRRWLLLMTVCSCSVGFGQSSVTGKVADEQGNVLELATTALLYPTDSTVAYFAMSNELGVFELTAVREGDYLLHVSQFGYAPKMIPITVSGKVNAGLILLKEEGENLEQVEIMAERTPLSIKGDTIEYNAAAFKTKPDGVVEDLLQKLPGVEVDASGNIKAQGQTIEKITVDGKEFFSNDPKAVTKNLPADAVKKVQVFDGKTDEEQFSGIDDGNQDRTINLVLKEDRKHLWFGSMMAGGGTDYHYQSALKAFRFTPENQLAFLGNSNNINQFGFSINDYIDFNGGLRNFTNGSARLEFNEDSPVDLGQPVYGKNLSGIGAFNYTRTGKPGKSFNITGMGTGRHKRLEEEGLTEQYLSTSTIHTSTADTTESSSGNYRINMVYRDKSDTSRLFNTSGYVQFGNGGRSEQSFGRDSSQLTVLNERFNTYGSRYDEWRGGINLDMGHRFSSSRISDILRWSVNGSGIVRNDRSVWSNDALLYTTAQQISDQQHLSTDSRDLNGDVSVSSVKQIGKNLFFEAAIDGKYAFHTMNRFQQEWLGSYAAIDSLTGPFSMRYLAFVPSAALRYSGKKLKCQLTTAWEAGELLTQHPETIARKVSLPVPFLSFSYERKQGRTVALDMTSRVDLPALEQLNPLPVTVNRMQTVSGNQTLKPEYRYDASLRWSIFDHFSFVSFFSGLQFSYTRDKISLNREILPDFRQVLTYVNMPEEYATSAYVDFSAPIRKLHLTVHLKADERWSRGLSTVNQELNVNENWSHSAEIMLENRKKAHWDVQLGDRLTISQANYSLQHSLNSSVTENTLYASVSFSPNDRWNLSTNADLKQYITSAGTFNTFVPLVRCSVMRTILKNRRASVKLEVFDLLNRNTGLQQFMQQNYFRVTQSTILRRYAMLSFTWKINKAGASKD